jgi:uncharacterized protein (DUF2267 family)
MSMTRPANFDHALQTATVWLQDVAAAFPTEDGEFAFRALRAWLHILRDRITVEAAAHLGAQLPELLRGVYYEGWDPHEVPKKYDAQEFITRFAQEAVISRADVPGAGAANPPWKRLRGWGPCGRRRSSPSGRPGRRAP